MAGVVCVQVGPPATGLSLSLTTSTLGLAREVETDRTRQDRQPGRGPDGLIGDALTWLDWGCSDMESEGRGINRDGIRTARHMSSVEGHMGPKPVTQATHAPLGMLLQLLLSNGGWLAAYVRWPIADGFNSTG